MSSVKTAVIPVAGRGTRFLPATKAIPKELLPLVDTPVVQYIVEEAVQSGIERIVFITSPDKGAIREHFSRNEEFENVLRESGKGEMADAIIRAAELAEFHFVPQEEPLGLGHAVLCAKDVVGDAPFLVFGGDDVVRGKTPAAKELVDTYDEKGGSVIGVIDVPAERINRYGVVDPKSEIDATTMELQGIVEKPKASEAPSSFGVGGRWLLTPGIFSILETTQPGAGGEIQLTDAILELMENESVFARVYSGTYHDCGNVIEYAKAVIAHSVDHPVVGESVRAFIADMQNT